MSDGLAVEVLELLSARLCHELISPVAAINNGIELLQELGDSVADEAIGLVAQSGRRASGRLRCYRLAYGAAGGGAMVGLDETREIAEAYLDGGKVTLDWPPKAGADAVTLPPGTIKMLLNLVVMGADALPYGGRASVGLRLGATPAEITVMADGRAAGLRDQEAQALAGTSAVDDLTARSVHAYVTGVFARHYAMTLTTEQAEDGPLTLRLALPE